MNQMNDITQYDSITYDNFCESCKDESHNFNIDVCIRGISKPASLQIRQPLIVTDNISYIYSFDLKKIYFETKTCTLTNEDVSNFLILNEDKRYVFVLFSNNKLVIFDYDNLDNRQNFCKDVIQMIKSDNKIFFLVKKEHYYYINEAVFKEKVFTHKIVSSKFKESDPILLGTGGKFYIATKENIYDKNLKLLLSYTGNFVYEIFDLIIIGNKMDNIYVFKLYENSMCISTIELNIDSESCIIKSHDHYIVVFTSKKFIILKIFSDYLDYCNEYDANFMVYNFDFYIYNQCLFLTFLTDESDLKNNNYIVNLTDLNDSVVLNHIKNTSDLKSYYEDKENKIKLIDKANGTVLSDEENKIDIISENLNKEKQNFNKKIINKILKGAKLADNKSVNEDHYKIVSNDTTECKEENNKKSNIDKVNRFKKYLSDTQESNGNLPNKTDISVNLTEVEIILQKLFDKFENNLNDKIETTINKVLSKTDFYKNFIFDTFVPKLEGCLNEIRIQAISEVKELKTILLSQDTLKFVEFKNNLKKDVNSGIGFFCSLNGEDLNDVILGINKSSNILSKLDDNQLIVMLHKATESYKNIELKTYSIFCELILHLININNISKKSITMFSMVLKHISNIDFDFQKKSPEIFYLINFFKKKLKKKLENCDDDDEEY